MLRQIAIAAAFAFSLPVLGASPALATPYWIPAEDTVLDFDVLRKGKPFGRHKVIFDVDDDQLSVRSEIDLQVKVGPFTAFKYAHENVETWIDGQLVALKSQTRKDGKDFEVVATALANALQIEATEFSGEVQRDVTPSSHWNFTQMTQDAILSTETGEMLPIRVENLGVERIEAGGQEINATRYRLYSDLNVDLWYDEANRWVKCAFEARGQPIEYVLR